MSLAGVRHLAGIAGKDRRLIIGLMSGTSLDGLDIALCEVSGAGFDTEARILKFETADYSESFRSRIRAVFAKTSVDLEALTLLHPVIADTHAELVLDALSRWGVSPAEVDLVASHGQTIYHAPRSLHGDEASPNATLQIGDGDHLSVRTGIITISDFRQKHIAAGGEGAPLAAYGDALLFSAPDRARVLLNIGGIANYTFLPPSEGHAEAFSSDIGPGNTLMDAVARQHDPSLPYDRDAALARAGSVNDALLRRLKGEAFFGLSMPKTTGPELFSMRWLERHLHSLGAQVSTPDLMATLNRFSAETIADAIGALDPIPEIFVSGGGARNPLLMENLAHLLPGASVQTTEALGIEPDAKEAVLFAVLANELVAGSMETFRGRIRGGPAVTMGKVSFPD
ncbi:anhydro-N-acetylmuramic acid kinase [Parvularcula lutaonensis]|uniref:Anhydro-N-acetylmuramic acid kinase n=1 Tax=Parvularcula lutaonensis TaxID=491923 RepID=A0ABV7M8Q0_9PROT|nr:anhydro-N-acetylmuramic acid kinase [Parvularcula lutaonensis]GGY56380.1 anhydro-N-acetylmuramic acid kinase [Parvularcula lutaonensis]